MKVSVKLTNKKVNNFTKTQEGLYYVFGVGEKIGCR